MQKVKIAAIVLIVLLAIGFVNRIFNGAEIDKRNAERDSLAKVEASLPKPQDIQQNIIEKLKSEQKVKDVVITDAKVVYIAIQDDGTKRDGLAEYFCQIVKPFNQDLRIKLVKYGSQNDKEKDSAYGVILGESDCK